MRPIRFVHMSDVHLDTTYSACRLPPVIGARKREAARAALRHILDQVRVLRADLVFIAGDLFEHDRVTPDTVEFLRRQFAGLTGARIFIAPGNHDPFLQGSPYREAPWPENVRIFSEETFRSVELDDLAARVTGFGFNRTQFQDRLFAGLPVLPDDRFNFVLAHASEAGRLPEGKASHGPFSIEEIAGKNVGYCALGHYHQQRQVENGIDAAQVWYPGIPEGRTWDEEDGCGYLYGEVSDAGSVVMERRQCQQYPFRTLELSCDDFSTREQIAEAILERRGGLFDPSCILRVRLRGSLDPRLDLSYPEIEERLSGELLHIVWEDCTEPALDFEGLAGEDTLRGRFIRKLNGQILAASAGERDALLRARLYGLQALLGREVRVK